MLILFIACIATVIIIVAMTRSRFHARTSMEPFDANTTYIDVRTHPEWQQNHVENALHIELTDLQRGKLPDVPKDAPIAVYCRSGHRARLALDILNKRGFTNVRNAGSVADLREQGCHIVGTMGEAGERD